MKKILLVGTVVFSLNLTGQTPGAGVTDIEGNSYETVIIGDLEWMAENLRVTKFSNGSSIQNVTDDANWGSLTTSAYCYMNNDLNTNPIFGLLYNHYAVVDANSLCPSGWRSPSMNDWNNLVLELDPNATIQNGTLGNNLGAMLKSTDPNAWAFSQWSNPTNSSNFSAVGAGGRGTSTFGAFLETMEGYYWSTNIVGTTTFGDPAAQIYMLANSTDDFTSSPNGNVKYGLSVRCVKNAQATGLIEIKAGYEKNLVKIVDLMGRETEFKPNTTLIYMYSDGSSERIFKLED